MQAFLDFEQLLHLAFEHLGHRYPGPLGDDLGDVFLIHFFLEHAPVFLHVRELLVQLVERFLNQRDLAIADFRGRPQIARTFRLLLAAFQVLQLLLGFANGRDDLFFPLPVSA